MTNVFALLSKVVYEGKKSDIIICIKEYGVMYDGLRQVGWMILVFLDWACSQTAAVLNIVLDFKIFNDDLIDKVVDFSWLILPITISILFILRMFIKLNDGIGGRIIRAIILLSIVTTLFSLTDMLFDIASLESSKTIEDMENDQYIKIVDVKKSVEDNVLTYVDTSDINLFSFNINDTTMDKPLNMKVSYLNKDNTIAYGQKLDKGMIFDEKNYLYYFPFWEPFFILLLTALFYIFTTFKIAINNIHYSFVQIITPVSSMLGGGVANIKMIMTSLFTAAMIIYVQILCVVYFRSVSSQIMLIENLLAKIILLFAIALFSINGSELARRMMGGQDLGVRGAMPLLAGAFIGGKATKKMGATTINASKSMASKLAKVNETNAGQKLISGINSGYNNLFNKNDNNSPKAMKNIPIDDGKNTPLTGNDPTKTNDANNVNNSPKGANEDKFNSKRNGEVANAKNVNSSVSNSSPINKQSLDNSNKMKEQNNVNTVKENKGVSNADTQINKKC